MINGYITFDKHHIFSLIQYYKYYKIVQFAGKLP